MKIDITMTTDLTTLLAEADAVSAAATPGPWIDGPFGDVWADEIEKVNGLWREKAGITKPRIIASPSRSVPEFESNRAFIAASRDLIPRLVAACRDQMAEIERLRKIVAGCDWYWPEDDTSSDACADGPWQIAENIDAKPGEVFGYARGGIVEVRYFGSLPAADDSDSDDEFEVDEPTREAAEEKISDELLRRAALQPTGKDMP